MAWVPRQAHRHSHSDNVEMLGRRYEVAKIGLSLQLTELQARPRREVFALTTAAARAVRWQWHGCAAALVLESCRRKSGYNKRSFNLSRTYKYL